MRLIQEIVQKQQLLKTLQDNSEFRFTEIADVQSCLVRMQDELALLVHRCSKMVNAGGRVVRSDQQANLEGVRVMLRDYAVTMLSCESRERRDELRRQIDSGKFIATYTGIRPGTVSAILDLKGKNRNHDHCAQTLFEICRDDGAFRVFEEFAKSEPRPCNQIKPEDLATLIAVRLAKAAH